MQEVRKQPENGEGTLDKEATSLYSVPIFAIISVLNYRMVICLCLFIKASGTHAVSRSRLQLFRK